MSGSGDADGTMCNDDEGHQVHVMHGNVLTIRTKPPSNCAAASIP
jgi:hypothetical protein